MFKIDQLLLLSVFIINLYLTLLLGRLRAKPVSQLLPQLHRLLVPEAQTRTPELRGEQVLSESLREPVGCLGVQTSPQYPLPSPAL